ncbi:hypothetical protein OSB04_028370 [Centaurea solstitialis]|uniref:Uncharacterized protein n=1 Tax=Centaurea solstitialis TaxID=347529 RepID=A0AA38W967_9ASTR|nr:hypothetical protein OSB04_028370 [Centaurea solstitialis]
MVNEVLGGSTIVDALGGSSWGFYKNLHCETKVLAKSHVLIRTRVLSKKPGSSIKKLDQGITKLSFGQSRVGKVQSLTSKKTFSIQAGYSDDGRSNSGSAFVGGFVLGGLLVGTLGCIYAPQISKALAAADKKELLKKLPDFIYDEEKALEKTRQKLAKKIAELNSAIDDVSSQLKSDDDEPVTNNGVVPDESEALA